MFKFVKKFKVMKKRTLLILILITIKSYSQDSSFGKPNFKIFWNYHNDFTKEVTKKSAFELKRVYLGYKYNFNDNISGKINFDIGTKSRGNGLNG